jgi:hypothetical protein
MKNFVLTVITAALAACTTSMPAPSPQLPTASPQPQVASPQPPTPQPTALLQPTATPQPKVTFTQLTAAGCCVQPFFSPEGERVMFLDKPNAGAQTGLYSVPINQPQAAPVFFNSHPGPYSRDMTLALDLVNGATQIRTADGARRWNINNGGRALSFSPDAKKIVWSVGEEFGGFDVRRNDIYLANVDGSNAQVVATRFGGGAQAWFADGNRVLIGGKGNRNDKAQRFSILNLADKTVRDLVEVERARGTSLSPDNRWLLYFVAQARDESQNGVFFISTTEQGAKPRELDIFGAYRWCANDRLLYVPLALNAPSNELWLIDIPSGARTQLIAAAPGAPFKIGNGDWSVFSRNGVTRIAYVNARDRGIWLADLGGMCG